MHSLPINGTGTGRGTLVGPTPYQHGKSSLFPAGCMRLRSRARGAGAAGPSRRPSSMSLPRFRALALESSAGPVPAALLASAYFTWAENEASLRGALDELCDELNCDLDIEPATNG